jgi:hypothetical protein
MSDRMQARFYVASVQKFAGQAREGFASPKPMGGVTLNVVTGGRGKANEQWASATPSGKMELTVNGEALEWFEQYLGQDMAITIEPRPLEELED